MSKTFNPTGLQTKDEWLTPPAILKSLGEFDLDPCSPINRPWPTAKQHYTILDNGLLKEWFGRVWCNPPYGRVMIYWLNKMALHNNGIALTFARTETKQFQQFVFPIADSILFIKGRLSFYNVDATKGKSNATGPSVLIAYGETNSDSLSESGIRGHHVPLNRMAVAVVSYDRSWQLVIKAIFIRLNRPADLNELYEEVERVAPDKVERNQHFKAKVRQTVQQHFQRVKRGTYAN